MDLSWSEAEEAFRAEARAWLEARCQGWSEPNAGSDLASVTSKAERGAMPPTTAPSSPAR